MLPRSVPTPSREARAAAHPLNGLEGDLIFLAGYYGSHLVHKETKVRGWLTFDALLGWNLSNHVELAIAEEGDADPYEPEAVLSRMGPFNVCADFEQLMREWQDLSDGRFRFHPFPYDWRREGQHTTRELLQKMRSIHESNGGQPILVCAHSMGGLCATAAMNAQPELFRGLVLVGTPFNGVPLILPVLQRGVPFLLGRRILSAELHFGARSSYIFLPQQGTGLYTADGREVDIDLMDPATWERRGLSQVFRHKPPDRVSRLVGYLGDTLRQTQQFRAAWAFRPEARYPPIALVTSRGWQTPTGFRATYVAPAPDAPAPIAEKSAATVSGASASASAATTTPPSTDNHAAPSAAIEAASSDAVPHPVKHITIGQPVKFEPGDGVVPISSTSLPEGYAAMTFQSSYHHVSIMNDTATFVQAIRHVTGLKPTSAETSGREASLRASPPAREAVQVHL